MQSKSTRKTSNIKKSFSTKTLTKPRVQTIPLPNTTSISSEKYPSDSREGNQNKKPSSSTPESQKSNTLNWTPFLLKFGIKKHPKEKSTTQELPSSSNQRPNKEHPSKDQDKTLDKSKVTIRNKTYSSTNNDQIKQTKKQ